MTGGAPGEAGEAGEEHGAPGEPRRRSGRSMSSEPLDLRRLVEEVRLGGREEEEAEAPRPAAARAVSRWRARKREEGRLARRVATLVARQRGARGGRTQ